MKIACIDSTIAPLASGGYSQAVEVSDLDRIVFISGQIPKDREGKTPGDFPSQARLAWANLEHQLEAVGLSLDNIAKHTTFLADRRYRIQNSEIRREILGPREPALTVVIAEIYDPEWLLEIEAIAVA